MNKQSVEEAARIYSEHTDAFVMGATWQKEQQLEDVIGQYDRKQIAAMCLQGALSNPDPGSIEDCVRYAVDAADALLTYLENTSK